MKRFEISAWLAFVVVLAVAAPVRADDKPSDPSEVFISGKAGKLQAYVWRPQGKGPFPAVVYNHGSERDPKIGTRGDVGPYLVKQGFVVLFPHRRGAGKSEGKFWEDRAERGKWQETIDALVEDNDDVVSAIEWLRAQPYVKRDRISVAGCSFGGVQTLLTAERSVGIYAAVDFAGGSMAWERNAPLRERLIQAAEHAKVPVFLLQAENDFNTAPSKQLSEAMKAKKLPHRMRIFPPHGSTPMQGHGGFCMRGSAEWGPDVVDFLTNRR